MSANIIDLQNKIIQIKTELSELNKGEEPLPEFIDTANMIRTNEYLQKSNEAKTKLLSAYEDYTKQLEFLISSISKIKGEITSLNTRIKSRKKPKRKTKSKKRKSKPKTRRKKPKSKRKAKPKRKTRTRRKTKPRRKTRKSRRKSRR